MAAPGYQALTASDIPETALLGGAGKLRVIAGEYDSARRPAHTHTPMNVWDLRADAGARVELPQPEGWTAAVVVLDGVVKVDGQALRAAQMATLGTEGSGVVIEAEAAAKLLLLAGAPIAEPVVGYGPFVMNSAQEVAQAITDFDAGKFDRVQSRAVGPRCSTPPRSSS